MDVGEDTSSGDSDTSKELVQLLVVAAGELDVAARVLDVLVHARARADVGVVAGEELDVRGANVDERPALAPRLALQVDHARTKDPRRERVVRFCSRRAPKAELTPSRAAWRTC